MRLHIIIPVVDERENLRHLLPYLAGELAGRGTITVADGGSTDGTAELIGALTQVQYLSCGQQGRAPQMNEAAALNLHTYDVLYFLHADTRPPSGFYNDIQRSVAEGYPVGCYRFRFDSGSPLLAINAFFTRFPRALSCRGGDQSLFLTREVWRELGGFDGSMQIMEDYDIIQRIWAAEIPFRVVPRSITVSARKYRANSWLRVQLANWKVFRMYKAGADEGEMIRLYRRRLRPW
ncbi:TIGR04283 family arsenosugar biosynthesis glycosyltransferase [Neolewinella sp.]|uniref:TIGR04283 family arsenosugar biosynthesis glycosyltransferase n=1 Tax=Neolewinella sp. TaxID=2993543 RepID=UPI003B518AB2